MKVVIIEDEKIVAERLEQLLYKIDNSISVLAKIRTIRDAVIWLNNNNPDLIFLDIHLADGLSFKIFEQIEIKTPVIFTTAYDQYAIKAFKVNSIDYLLKPINIDDLTQSINKYKDLIKTKSSGTIDFKTLIEAIDKKSEYKKRFTISIGRKIKIINTNDIAYFYVLEKSIFVHTYDNKNIAIDYSLDKLESLLDPEIFFRINRKYLININSIKNIYTLSKSRIKVELNPPANEDVIISFKRSGMFKKWLNQ
ncbi:MAG: response regulator transcription factor [Bacteroidales bacterium]|nr:response regulator transcription factor [Bacteroidales bacterium]